MTEKKSRCAFDTKKIIDLLPHRYPFLLVDRIIEFDVEAGTIIGQKNVTMNETFFQGHFPGAPLMPGVLILEALAQTGGILVRLRDDRDKVAILLSVNNAKFRRPVTPGDVLMLHARLLRLSSKGGKVAAQAFVDEKVAAEAEISFAIVDKEQI